MDWELLDPNGQRLCRLLVDHLLFDNFDLYSPETLREGGLYTGTLVAGTRDACHALQEVGILESRKPYYYAPAINEEEFETWLDRKAFSEVERDWLLRGACNLWKWYYSKDVTYASSPLDLSADFYSALHANGFVQGRWKSSSWTVKALPWLIESGLADYKSAPGDDLSEGSLLLSAMPGTTVLAYTQMAKSYPRRAFSLLCANWDGAEWTDKGNSLILPRESWLMGAAKSVVDTLRTSKEPL